MRALAAAEIILLWETAYRLHPIDQVLSILLQVDIEKNRDELAALPLGQRDALLLALRKATFGDSLPGRSECPRCDEAIEFELSCSALLAKDAEPQVLQIRRAGYTVTIRPLNSFDLALAASAASLPLATELLQQRCISAADYQGEPIDPSSLPPEMKNNIAETAEAADPQAEVQLELSCPGCQKQWQRTLAIGHILWLEISNRARRLLLEVHQLASAYGWTESEILKLSAARRAVYLQMVAT